MRGLSVLLLVLWMSPSTASAQEITAYPVRCNGTWDGTTCNGQQVALDRIFFAVFPETQAVVMSVAENPPVKLTRCAVRNKENWACDNPDTSVRLAMVDGTLKDDFGLVANVRYVSVWQWLRASAHAWNEPFFRKFTATS